MQQKNQNSQNTLNHFLVFRLGKEEFAVSARNVMEILEVPTFTKIPRSPEYMKGVINLKGSILPVVDTHIKFQLPPMEFTIDSCIIVLNVLLDGEHVTVGALVDEVKEVIEIGTDQIGPSPSIGSDYNPDFIEGMARVDGKFIMVLNIAQVFSTKDNARKRSNQEKHVEAMSA